MVVELGQCPGRRQVAHHDGEGLVQALLAGPQPSHRVRRGGVTGQVIPAETLDGDNVAAGERLLGRRDGCIGSLENSIPTLEPDPRAACGAGHRLRMEPPI